MNVTAPPPTFSVIIPSYNNGATLARAIESVLKQTYAAHEIIIVDDGSTDDTAVVVGRFEGRVRYLHQANAGVSAARNAGMAAATGNWLAFVDADDEFAPERLAAHGNWIRDEPDLDFLLADQEARDPNGALLWTNIAGCKAGRKLLARSGGAERIAIGKADFEDLIGDGFMEVRTISFPREKFVRLGGFPLGHKIGEDLHMFIRLIADSKKAGVVARPLATYYIYPTSALRKNPIEAAALFVTSLDSLAGQLRGASAPVRRGYRAKCHAVRMQLAHAYLRAGRNSDAVRAILVSLSANPSFRTLRDVLSIARGLPKQSAAVKRSP
jgi:glycosyltransferase involved in cell wall biosynthesis